MAAWLKQLTWDSRIAKRIRLKQPRVLGPGVRVVHQGFWRLITHDPIKGDQQQALHHGQLIEASPTDFYVFGEFDEAHEPAMEAVIAAEPENRAALHVYADWLLEHGDALGERILRPRGDDAHWLEGLGPELEVEWRDGLIDRAVVRDTLPVAEENALRRVVTRVLSLRAAAFVRHLVIDVAAGDTRKAGPQHEGAQLEATIRYRIKELLAGFGAMPALESLSFGYCLGPTRPAPVVIPRDDPRFPRLDPAPIFSWASRGLFEVLEAPALDGARPGDWVPAAGMRLRASGPRVILANLEESRGAWGWASASEVLGRVLLSLNQQLQSIEVNGRSAPQTFLLPGDVIDAYGEARTPKPAARLRFELER